MGVENITQSYLMGQSAHSIFYRNNISSETSQSKTSYLTYWEIYYKANNKKERQGISSYQNLRHRRQIRNRNNLLGNRSVNAPFPSKNTSRAQLKHVSEQLSIKETEQPRHSHTSLGDDVFVITDIYQQHERKYIFFKATRRKRGGQDIIHMQITAAKLCHIQ